MSKRDRHAAGGDGGEDMAPPSGKVVHRAEGGENAAGGGGGGGGARTRPPRNIVVKTLEDIAAGATEVDLKSSHLDDADAARLAAGVKGSTALTMLNLDR